MFKHNPSRFVKWFPIFQNMRQTVINWYHCTFNAVFLAFPDPICLFLDDSLSANGAHLARLHPDQPDVVPLANAQLRGAQVLPGPRSDPEYCKSGQCRP